MTRGWDRSTQEIWQEIAEIMECPVGTVRSRIFRAREAIDAVVKPLLAR